MNAAIQKELENVVNKNDEITSAVLLIYSDKQGLNESFAVGTTGEDLAEPVTIDHPYFSASIGKTFTATLICMLEEEGMISYDDPISLYLNDEVLAGLFVYEDVDYQDQVTIRQLLNHTSGVGDYFEDPVSQGDKLLDRMLQDPNKMWTPMELIDFTRNYQKAVAGPGEKFHYSDTGYNLLGLIIEAVTGKEFHEVFFERILDPLGMNDTYLMFMSEPRNPQKYDLLEVYVDGTDYSRTNALSIDWAGGGLATTAQDLLLFSKALNEGKLVSFETLDLMTDFDHKFQDGIQYGYGMMEFDFSGFSFLLWNMPNIYGGVGSTSTFMMYDKINDVHYIANYGALDFMEKSIPSLINIIMLVERLET